MARIFKHLLFRGLFLVFPLLLFSPPLPAQEKSMQVLQSSLFAAENNAQWLSAGNIIQQLGKSDIRKKDLQAHEVKMDLTRSQSDLAEILFDQGKANLALEVVNKALLTVQENYQPMDRGLVQYLLSRQVYYDRAAHPSQPSGLWWQLRQDLDKTLQLYLLPLLSLFLLYGVYVAYRALFHPYRAPFLEIALEDHLSDSDPNQANNILSQEFDQYLKRVVSEINDDAELDGLVNVDGSGLVSMTAGRRTMGITQYLDSTPIQIGVIKLTPKSIVELLSYAFRTRGQSVVTGALRQEQNGDYVLRLEKKPLNKKGAQLVIDGRAQNRGQAIRQAAMQLVVHESSSTVTRDWRSLEALVNAKNILRDQIEYSLAQRNDPGTESAPFNSILDKLQGARRLLQKSLAIDPSNWVARFRLANVLRKIGDNRTALWQYSYVLDLLCNQDHSQNKNLFAYVRSQPLFPLQILYNKTTCMARMGADCMRSPDPEQRQKGFTYVAMSIDDLRLLAFNIARFCPDDAIKQPLDNAVAEIDAVKSVLTLHWDSISPIDKSVQQMDALKQNLYEHLGLSRKARGEAKKVNLYQEKKAVKDLIYQIYSGLISSLAWFYEYPAHAHGAEQQQALFDAIVRLEQWFYDLRLELDDENRNAYAYSHAIAHNAVGRLNYLKVRYLLEQDAVTTAHEHKDFKRSFETAESFLRWAIGYHLPAGFADPYINLAALYIKALDYNSVLVYLPPEWKTRTEAYLQQAIRLSPNNSKAYYLLGRLYQSRVFEDRLLPGQSNSADSFFAKAIQQFNRAGEDSYSYYRAGQLYAERGDLETAVVKLTQCLRIYRYYDVPHQLYLNVQAQLLEQQLASLNAADTKQMEQFRKTLNGVVELCTDINEHCFVGDGDSEKCGPLLERGEIQAITERLIQLDRKSKDLSAQTLS
ncbi:MAG: tetratricopeptide repeat protein [Gammaproteobacteria bacterium]|nr:tetratricopeptide repeat protein [Gammaproteobacteria bacterium]MDH5803259.1 tetratricopeptide repeat protein [Gammaproteobacteria bacterium]